MGNPKNQNILNDFINQNFNNNIQNVKSSLFKIFDNT